MLGRIKVNSRNDGGGVGVAVLSFLLKKQLQSPLQNPFLTFLRHKSYIPLIPKVLPLPPLFSSSGLSLAIPFNKPLSPTAPPTSFPSSPP